MSEQPVFIPVLLGTNRKGRESEKIARWVHDKLEARSDIETEWFDVAGFNLPADDYGQVLKDRYPEWRDAVIRCDGLVLVTPEYNHAYPGALKSVLDVLLKEYIHKAVAFVGVSAGPFGGSRAIESLVPMVRELGLTPTFTDLSFPKVGDQFDDQGKLKDSDSYDRRFQSFADELVWMSRSLRWGRRNLESKHHTR